VARMRALHHTAAAGGAFDAVDFTLVVLSFAAITGLAYVLYLLLRRRVA